MAGHPDDTRPEPIDRLTALIADQRDRTDRAQVTDALDAIDGATTSNIRPVYGMCTACGCVEVELLHADGQRDLSHMGESPNYPTGYGCEVCS